MDELGAIFGLGSGVGAQLVLRADARIGIVDVGEGVTAGDIGLAGRSDLGADPAAGRELDVEAILQNLVARDFGAHKGRRTEVEVIADGGAGVRVVEAGAGHITPAHSRTGLTAIGWPGGDNKTRP